MKSLKVNRVFSTEFKKEKVALIESGKLRISDICKTYDVSDPAVRKWLVKFGKLVKSERVVIEKISEQTKNIELLKHIASLERVIGKQQLQIIYKESVIESASELIGEDLEKKYNSQQSKKH
jgi:transposase-like protein